MNREEKLDEASRIITEYYGVFITFVAKEWMDGHDNKYHNNAKDITQESLVKLYETLHSPNDMPIFDAIDNEMDLKAYIFAAVRNNVKRYYLNNKTKTIRTLEASHVFGKVFEASQSYSGFEAFECHELESNFNKTDTAIIVAIKNGQKVEDIITSQELGHTKKFYKFKTRIQKKYNKITLEDE